MASYFPIHFLSFCAPAVRFGTAGAKGSAFHQISAADKIALLGAPAHATSATPISFLSRLESLKTAYFLSCLCKLMPGFAHYCSNKREDVARTTEYRLKEYMNDREADSQLPAVDSLWNEPWLTIEQQTETGRFLNRRRYLLYRKCNMALQTPIYATGVKVQ